MSESDSDSDEGVYKHKLRRKPDPPKLISLKVKQSTQSASILPTTLVSEQDEESDEHRDLSRNGSLFGKIGAFVDNVDKRNAPVPLSSV